MKPTLLRFLAWQFLLPALALASGADALSPSDSGSEESVPAKGVKHVVVLPRGNVREEPTLRLNFRGAPLETVLSYLSDAAGYTIIVQAPLSGTLDAWNAQLLTRSEALEVLNSALNKNGLTALQDGKTLTVLRTSDAKRGNLPIRIGSRADEIPKNDAIVTQIMPVHFLSAGQLIRDLQAVLPPTANVATSEGGNSILITDSQANIRRFAEIVQALDTSSSAATHFRIFPLAFADSKSIAALIKELFTPDTSRNQQNAGLNFGGGVPPGQDATPAPVAGNSNARTAKAGKVLAVADERSNAVIVTAPDDLMSTIEELVKNVDTNVEDVTELRLFRLKNADPTEIAELIGGLFPDTSKSSANTASPFASPFGGGPGGPGGPFGQGGGGGGATASTGEVGERAKKQGTVVTVADARSKSVIVKASHELMRQVEKTILELDADPKGKQKVYVYSLNNADSAQVQQVLEGIFQSQQANRGSSSATKTSALMARAQQASTSKTSSSSFSGSASAGGGGTGGSGGAAPGR